MGSQFSLGPARKPLFLPAYSCNSCYSWFASFKKSLAGKWTVGNVGKEDGKTAGTERLALISVY